MASMVQNQYIEQGPVLLAELLQFIPSFNLYRGLYELSQASRRIGVQGRTGRRCAPLGCSADVRCMRGRVGVRCGPRHGRCLLAMPLDAPCVPGPRDLRLGTRPPFL